MALHADTEYSENMDHNVENGQVAAAQQLQIPVLKEEEENKVHFRTLFKENWVSVFTDCLVFGSFGMGVAILGPTLFDLGCQTNSDLKEMDWVFFVQLLMTLVGSVSAGTMAERGVPLHILLVIGIVGLPFTTFLVPACYSFAGLLIDLMIMGWCMGSIDCVANLRMILRFGTDVSPFLQAMHFFYGLGAFISPMIAAAFILNVDCTPYIDGIPETIKSAPNITNWTSTMITPSPGNLSLAQHLSHSERAFFILGSIQFGIAAVVAVVIVLEKKRIIETGAAVSQASSFHSMISLGAESKDGQTEKSKKYRCFTCGTKETVLITLLTSCSLFIYDGLQSSYADYIYSYAEKNIEGLQKGEGAILNACFWGTFAFGRLIAIPCATRLTAHFMLTINLGGSIFALLITLMWRTNHVAVYIGTCVLGLFLSSMSPTAMSMTEQFLDINPSIASCLVVCAALGETLCPVIVGNLFVLIGPPTFLSFCTTICGIAILLFVVAYLIGKNTSKYRDSKCTSFLWLPGYNRKSGGESMLINATSVKYYSRMEEEDSVDNMTNVLEDTKQRQHHS